MKLNQLMWRSLLRVFVVALPLAVVAVWAGQTASIGAMKRALMSSNRDQLRSALVKVSDRKMLDKAWKAAGMLTSDGTLTDEQMDRMLRKVEADEIHICDSNGVIVRTSVPEYLGLDFRKHRQTLPFCDLLHGKEEYAQEFGPIAYDAHRYRKFVGVALKRGGLLQLGFNEDRYLPEPNFDRVRIVGDRAELLRELPLPAEKLTERQRLPVIAEIEPQVLRNGRPHDHPVRVADVDLVRLDLAEQPLHLLVRQRPVRRQHPRRLPRLVEHPPVGDLHERTPELIPVGRHQCALHRRNARGLPGPDRDNRERQRHEEHAEQAPPHQLVQFHAILAHPQRSLTMRSQARS